MEANEMIALIKILAKDNPKPSDIEEVIYMNSKTLEKILPATEDIPDGLAIQGIPVMINNLIPDDIVYKTSPCCNWSPDYEKNILPSIRPKIYPYTNYKQSD